MRVTAHPSETFWLLTASDYRGESESAFAWNEWELITTDATLFGASEIAKTTSFWDRHFPLALSVRDGYEYFAMTCDGHVVTDGGPDFESTDPFADSYAAFIRKIAPGH